MAKKAPQEGYLDEGYVDAAPQTAGPSVVSGYEAPAERGFLEKTHDLLKRAQVEGIGGAIAYPALRAQGWSPEQIKQAHDDFLAEMDAKDRADYAANPDESRFHQFITGKWVPHLFAALGGQPEYLISGGGSGVASRLAHAAGSAEAVDAVTQGIQNIEGLRDGIDFKRLNDTGAMTAVLGLPLEGLAALRSKFFPRKAEDGNPAPADQAPAPTEISPEQLAAVDAISKTATADELRALGVANADEVVAAREKGAGVTKAVAGEQVHPAAPEAPAPVAPEEFAPDITVTAPKEGAFKHSRDLGDGSHVYNYSAPDGREIPVRLAIDDGVATVDVDKFNDAAKNTLGPVETRNAIYDMVNQFPEITEVGGFRRTGAGAGREQTIPITDKLREKAAQYEAIKNPPKAEPTQIDLPEQLPEPTVQAGKGVDLNGDAVYKPAPEIPEGEMPKYAKSINLEKLDTTKDVDEYILEQSKAIPRDYQSHQETEDLAAILGQDTAALLKKNPELSELPQYAVALHNTLVEASNNVVSLAKKVKAGENSDEALDELFKAVLVQRHIQERATKVSGVAGRTLEAHKIIKSGGASYAKALADLPQAKINSRESLEELAGVLADAPDAAAVNKIIADTQKKTLWDKIIGFRYNMMLFGPTTHTANNIGIFSTVTHDLLNQSLASTTGQVTRSADRVAAREVAARVEGMMAGLFSGAAWRNSRKALNEGDILTPTGKSEHTVQNEGNIGDLVALGSRTLNAEDEFWRTIIHSGSNYALAYRTALKEGRKGAAFKARVQGLINSPTPELVAASDEYAHRMLLRDTPTPITAGFMRWRVIKKSDPLSIKAFKGATQIVFPFVRVLDRATMYSIRHSPLSFLDRVTQADFKAGGARAEIAKARIATGTALATWAALKAYNGELTGPGPADFEANQKWQAAGHRPNSIVVDGQYRDISNLLPLSIPLTTIAAAVEDAKTGKFSEKSYQDKIETLTGDVIAGLGTNTWTSSIADLGKMVTGSQGQKDAARKGYIANVASSFVPAFLRQFNQADPMGLGDPSVRVTSGDGSLGQRVLGRVASAVPGVSEDLPQKYNVYGKPVMREGVYGPGFLSNIKVSDLDPDPAVREMDRLMAANDYQGGVTPVDSSLQVPDYAEPPAELAARITTGANGRSRLKLNADEVSEYQRVAGTYITDYVRQQIKSPEWKRMSDDERREDLADTVEKAKSQARDELFWSTQEGYADASAPAAKTPATGSPEADAVAQKFGVYITDSGTRPHDEQKRLYAKYKGVAPPGTSDHEYGAALDVRPKKGVNPAAIRDYLTSLGHQNVTMKTARHGSGLHWHFQWTPEEGYVN